MLNPFKLRVALLLLAVVLPGMLVLGAWRTVRALDQQKEIVFRSRAASIAAHLETLSDPAAFKVLQEQLAEEEPGLVQIDLQPLSLPDPATPATLRDGRELFHLQRTQLDGQPVFRAWLPSHIGGQVYIVRIDLAEDVVAGFLKEAQQNVWVASLGAFAVILLSLTLAIFLQRTARAEQRQLELEHLARLGQMSAVLAHEIRNPLGTIKGFAQLLSEQAEPAQLALIQPIVSEANRLENLVRDLLLYGRPPLVQPRLVELASLLPHLTAHLQPSLDQHPAEIVFHVPAGLSLTTDPDLLSPAVLNLLRNSIEALDGRPSARIELAARSTGQTVQIVILDNGPGLSPAAQSRLFEPFHTTKSFGTGLGLSITRKLIEALGGRLDLANQPTHGVMATIQLPATESQP